MARIKRRINNTENQMNKIAKCDFFEAGIYRRISVEQDGDEPNRDSMENQMKIALEFVKTHPDVTPAELMAISDAQSILQGSRYNPS